MDKSAHAPEHDDPEHQHLHERLHERLQDDPKDAASTGEPGDGPVEAGLDPATDSHVRALLAAAPDPGPMPAEVSARISAALRDAARLRVEPGPLAAEHGAAGATGTSGTGGHDGARSGSGASVLPMPSRPSGRPKPVYLVAAVAAATAVVAVGASALHITKRPNGAAAIGDTYTSRTTSSGASSAAPSTSAPHIQLSRTAYTGSNLAAQARTLLGHPGEPVRDLAAESPAVGPIATRVGLESCLQALGAVDGTRPAPESVSVDLATFDGRPAAVVVVTRAGASTAWAVERSCTTGAPGVLHDATPVP